VVAPPRVPRILIVEDEIAIALELEACLRDAGFDTIGPAIDMQEAASFIAEDLVDAAIFDAGLIDRSSDKVMGPLMERRIPFLLMSGYVDYRLPAWMPDTDTFTKPFALGDIVERLRASLAPQLGSC
jgi:DNA-binding response OmpR family regulator